MHRNLMPSAPPSDGVGRVPAVCGVAAPAAQRMQTLLPGSQAYVSSGLPRVGRERPVAMAMSA